MQVDERAQMMAAMAACGVTVLLCCRTSDAQMLEARRRHPIERNRQSDTLTVPLNRVSAPLAEAPVASPRELGLGQEQRAEADPQVVPTEEQGATEGAHATRTDKTHTDKTPGVDETPSLPASMAWHQLGGELLSSEGVSAPRTLVPTATALSDKKLVAVFFSARWSAPCLDFTPRLVKWYVEAAAKLNVEVVYVSCDVDEDGFVAHAEKMPWLAMPFADRQRATEMRNSLGVMSIPSVVLLGSDGLPQSHDVALQMLPGLPQVIADSEGDDVTTSQSPARSLARLRDAKVHEYILDGVTRTGKRIAGWHSREKPDKKSRALRCYLDGAVVRASELGPWLQLERGQGFLRKEHWGAGWHITTDSQSDI